MKIFSLAVIVLAVFSCRDNSPMYSVNSDFKSPSTIINAKEYNGELNGWGLIEGLCIILMFEEPITKKDSSLLYINYDARAIFPEWVEKARLDTPAINRSQAVIDITNNYYDIIIASSVPDSYEGFKNAFFSFAFYDTMLVGQGDTVWGSKFIEEERRNNFDSPTLFYSKVDDPNLLFKFRAYTNNFVSLIIKDIPDKIISVKIVPSDNFSLPAIDTLLVLDSIGRASIYNPINPPSSYRFMGFHGFLLDAMIKYNTYNTDSLISNCLVEGISQCS